MTVVPTPSPSGTVVVRNLDARLKQRLRLRAARNGRSVSAELRAILAEALDPPAPPTGADLAEAIRRRFAPLGGVELELPPREIGREPPSFDE